MSVPCTGTSVPHHSLVCVGRWQLEPRLEVMEVEVKAVEVKVAEMKLVKWSW